MIESQAELPAQEHGPATIWAKGRQMVTFVRERLRDRGPILPGARAAKYLGDVGSLASNGARESRPFQWIKAGIGDGSLLNRYALHLVVVFLAVAVVTISQVTLPEVDLRLPPPTPAPELGTHSVSTQPTNRGVNRLVGNNGSLFAAPVLHTIVSERDRMEIITYTVQPNDNIWAIAQGIDLRAETVLWANPKV